MFDEKIQKLFPRYVGILTKNKHPKFKIAKSIECGVSLNSPLEGLLEEHEKIKEKFPEILREVDGGLSLKEPKVSFLDLKAEIASRYLEECCLCERRCGADRKHGERGECGVGKTRVSTIFRHMGEEYFISPSLTVFFSGCNFHCAFCQNWDISQFPESGEVVSPERLAQRIDGFSLIRNLNLVGGEPTPNLPAILETLQHVNKNLPVVWNSNFYMSEESVELLEEVVDVYLSDFKYGNDECAQKYSKVGNYFEVVSRNHLLAGELLIRHLVLPNHIECCTKPILRWIKENTPNALVNIMGQYRPQYKAKMYPELARPVSLAEFDEVIEYAKELGLNFIF